MYKPEERNIFEFFNGEKDVKGDPLAIHRKLATSIKKSGHDLDAMLKIVSNPMEDISFGETVEVLTTHIRDTFGIKPFEDGGLTEGELIQLFSAFLLYLMEVKKKQEKLAILSEPIIASQEPEDSTTPNTSDSSSTEIVC